MAGREGGRDGGRERRKEGRKEGGREGGKEDEGRREGGAYIRTTPLNKQEHSWLQDDVEIERVFPRVLLLHVCTPPPPHGVHILDTSRAHVHVSTRGLCGYRHSHT